MRNLDKTSAKSFKELHVKSTSTRTFKYIWVPYLIRGTLALILGTTILLVGPTIAARSIALYMGLFWFMNSVLILPLVRRASSLGMDPRIVLAVAGFGIVSGLAVVICVLFSYLSIFLADLPFLLVCVSDQFVVNVFAAIAIITGLVTISGVRRNPFLAQELPLGIFRPVAAGLGRLGLGPLEILLGLLIFLRPFLSPTLLSLWVVTVFWAYLAAIVLCLDAWRALITVRRQSVLAAVAD